MASVPVVLIAALAAAAVYSGVGLALARWLRLGCAPAASLAPALGWATFSAVSFPLQSLFGFSRASTALLTAAGLGLAVAVLARMRRERAERELPRLLWAGGLAAAVALIPLVGLVPKVGSGGIILGPTVFDHSKIAMVDEITRLGLPAGNPFFGAFGSRSVLAYYYLWHFSAAQLSILGGVSGWEADAAMTGVTAYASLMLMMGLAMGVAAPARDVRAAGGRRARARPYLAIGWVALLSLTGSLRPLLHLLLGDAGMDRLLSPYRGLAGWMVQASWAPQHLAAACCAVLAALLLAELWRRPRVAVVLVVAALAAAGFGSSAWIGGVVFAAAAGGVGTAGLLSARGWRRLGFAAGAAAAAVLALVLVLPLLPAEFAMAAHRRGGSPIAYHPYEVIGAMVPSPGLRRALDYPGYWLLLLPIDIPAIYLAGLAGLGLRLWSALRARAARAEVLSLANLVFWSFATAWLLASTIGNNDLGWRGILPGVLVLTAFAAAGLASWMTAPATTPSLAPVGALAAATLFGASVPDGLISANFKGRQTDNAPDFADSPALWAAVRRYAGPADRVADNPLAQDDMTEWPVNPSWAMLSNRASCYSGWETVRVAVDLSKEQVKAMDDQMIRVFNGGGTADDVGALARDYGCRVVVVTPEDGAWSKDPFARSPDYRLAEVQPDRWRIYVALRQRRSALRTPGQPPDLGPRRDGAGSSISGPPRGG